MGPNSRKSPFPPQTEEAFSHNDNQRELEQLYANPKQQFEGFENPKTHSSIINREPNVHQDAFKEDWSINV